MAVNRAARGSRRHDRDGQNTRGPSSDTTAGISVSPAISVTATAIASAGPIDRSTLSVDSSSARNATMNDLGPDDEPHYAREPGHLALARILLAQDRPGQALALLDRLHAAAAAQDRTGSLIETGALLALALADTGDEAAAVTTLARALSLACPQGYVRVFADEGPPMAALLGRVIAAQRTGQAAAHVPIGYLARLQRAFGPGPPARDPVPSGIVDPLTSRELEVLEKLAAGRSNQAIARELVAPWTPSRSTWAMSWASSARPTAPRPSPGPAS